MAARSRRPAALQSRRGVPYVPIMDQDRLTAAPPEDCEDMADVRVGVDEVDRALVRLLARRQGYMAAAARIKPRAADVRVPWRVEQVVQNVLAESEAAGLSPRIAEPVWRELIERSIEFEGERWAALRAGGGAKPVPEQVRT